MKFFFETLLILILGFLAHQILPWWVIAAVAAAVGAYYNLKAGASFLAGFIAAALLWGGYAGVLNFGNMGILSEKIGELFGGIGGAALVFITGLWGGIFGGLGALTGSMGRKLIER